MGSLMMRLTSRPAILPLGVVEVGRHGDDGLGDGLAQTHLRVRLQFRQDHGGDLGRGVGLVAHLDGRVAVGRADDLVGHHRDLLLHLIELAPHETLDGVDRPLRVHDRLALGGEAHQTLAVGGEGHDRRRGALPLRVFQHAGLAAFHHGHARIRRAQVNAKNLAHKCFPFVAGSPRAYATLCKTCANSPTAQGMAVCAALRATHVAHPWHTLPTVPPRGTPGRLNQDRPLTRGGSAAEPRRISR